MNFHYENNPLNGVFRSYVNKSYPLILLEPSSTSGSFVVSNIYEIDDSESHWASDNLTNQWLNIYLLPKKLLISGYSLRSYPGNGNIYYLSNWTFLFFYDNLTWDQQVKHNILMLQQSNIIQNFRILMTGKTKREDNILRISTFDLFGKLIDCSTSLIKKNLCFSLSLLTIISLFLS